MASQGGATFSKEDILSLINSREEEAEKEYSKDVDLECEVEKEEFYIYENSTLNCVVRNNGNAFFEDMKVCFKEECKNVELGISQEKKVEFSFSEKDVGKKEKEVKASSEDALKTLIVKYSALDAPSIKIINITYPKSVEYKEEYTVEFLMKKESFSNPVYVEIILNQEGYEKVWTIEEMRQDRRFIIDMKGSNMVNGENEFEIRVDFKDRLGNDYKDESNIDIDLVGLSLVEKLLVSSNVLGRKVLSGKGFVQFMVISGIVFTLIFLVVFKRGNNER